MRPLITLLTDFGTADGYGAELKGVLYTALPDANVVDLSHDIPPQDIELARLAVARYWHRFPAGTIHLVIVDPTVGTTRASLVVESDGRMLLGPDNGVLSPALLRPDARAFALQVLPSAAPTFHGRDVFAPAAAAIAAGAALESLGAPFPSPVIRRTREPTRLSNGAIAGEVIAIDRYGNAVTNILGAHAGRLDVGGRYVDVVRTYGDVPAGSALALAGSSGLLEVAIRDGSAARELELTRGAPVIFRRS
ncbi:MAG: Adenosyl-chloride synthase [Gemmatimonadaceae bacterium]|nr:Adenosyl-chloride synthase [Gemmatimonadaceae bacterium]